MSKWANILIGDDGLPYLIDYQIHFWLPRNLPLRWAQAADLYYFHRHWLRCRPDQIPPDDHKAWSRQSMHVWIAERIGPALRRARLLVLRLHGVRGDPRKPGSPANG